MFVANNNEGHSKWPQTSQQMIIVPSKDGPTSGDEALEVQIQHVFDGDGFRAKLWNPYRQRWVPDVQFRFAFIDAPEKGQPFGDEARDCLHGLIGGKTLRLDPIFKESMNGVPFDPYKRILCMGFLTEEMGAGEVHYYHSGECSVGHVKRARTVTRNVELEMIINGWAWVVEQYSFEHSEAYFTAQEDAQRHRRGLWRADNPEPPWNFKRRQRRQKATKAQHGLAWE